MLYCLGRKTSGKTILHGYMHFILLALQSSWRIMNGSKTLSLTPKTSYFSAFFFLSQILLQWYHKTLHVNPQPMAQLLILQTEVISTKTQTLPLYHTGKIYWKLNVLLNQQHFSVCFSTVLWFSSNYLKSKWILLTSKGIGIKSIAL